MFDSGYTPGGVTSLLQSTTAKKTKHKDTETEKDEKETSVLTELFSRKETKKRKLSESEAPNAKSPDSKEDATAQPKKRRKKSHYLGDVDKRQRTIFVGNIPIAAEKKALKRLFKQFGDIESLRFRSAAPADPKCPKKKAIVKGTFDPSRSSMNAYIVFKEVDTAKAALEMNGKEIDQHHLRVDLAFSTKEHDHSKCVFVGGLPYSTEDEELRQHFADCGAIEDVRIIRDKKTGLGKGFGYVKFQEKDSVHFALQLDGEKLKKFKLRVQLSKKPDTKAPSKGKEGKKDATPKKAQKKLPKPSNAVQGTFGGEKAEKMKQMKRKKEKKIKKQRDLRKKKKMAKALSNEGQPKKEKVLSSKIQSRNRLAKKQKKSAKK